MTPDQQSRSVEENILLAVPPIPGGDAAYLPLPKPSAVPPRPRVDLLDLLLTGFTVTFAFLASSFAISNSDFWSHLADGRALIQRQVMRGGESLTSTSSWLFDVLLYLLYAVIGGGGVVVVKAVLIAILAGFLLRLRRSDRDGGWPAACTLLVLLVLSPYLALEPAILSYLFLALTLRLLARPYPKEEKTERVGFHRSLQRFWLLPLLVALWNNVDSGFLLGPLLIALFRLGERVERLFRRPAAQARERVSFDCAAGRPKLPAWLLLACLGACFVNPHPLHIFTWPIEFTPGVLSGDDAARRFLSSPWQWDWKDGPRFSQAGYFVLLGLGAPSFLLNRRRLSGWRLAVWIGFALLSVWRTGFVPFFAVVAGPITALNMQDFLCWGDETTSNNLGRRRGNWSRLSHLALLMPALALVLFAGTGRLRGLHGEPQPMCWRVQADASLQRLAETMASWRQQGRLHEGERLLAFHPSVVHYCACFSPAVELRCPQRFQSGAEAASFEEARRELGYPADSDTCSTLLRAWNIAYTVAEDAATRDVLLEHPRRWLLVDVAGRAALFAWRGSPAANVSTPFDAPRLAFAPSAEDRDAPPVPPQGPGRGPLAPSFWTLVLPAPSSSGESEAAATYLHCFHKEMLPRYSARWLTSWSAYAASLCALPSPPAPAANGVVSVLARLHHPTVFVGDLEGDLPALPFLALRAARRALAANPDDAQAYLRLGQAYFALWEETGEKPLSGGNTLLLELRHVQMAAALEQAVLRDPACLGAHHLLARLYLQRTYLDAALEHQHVELRLTRQAGPRRGENSETFQGRLRRLEQQVHQLESIVEERHKQLEAAGREDGGEPVRRATTALALGLARHALENILQPVPPVILESKGLQLELQLMARLGRVEALRELMLDPQWQQDQANLGWLSLPAPRVAGYPQSYRLPFYAWTRLGWTASVGDYERAEDQLQDLVELLRRQYQHQTQRLRVSMARAVTTEIVLSSQPQSLFLQPVLQDGRWLVASSFAGTSTFQGDQADLRALGGLLAVERGLPRLAEAHLKQAYELYPQKGEIAPDFAMHMLVDTYLQRLRRNANSSER